MKFVVDAQLPPALARLLREAGCDAFAVREIGLREASDAEIWRCSVQQQAAIITKDEDFAERCLYSRDQPESEGSQRNNGSLEADCHRYVFEFHENDVPLREFSPDLPETNSPTLQPS